ncbi:MAG: hypothetical protein H7Z42_18525 [Roseiflexaceae bacterium]|nr:hypothetical protein [Roseiflexaceae bacterium]
MTVVVMRIVLALSLILPMSSAQPQFPSTLYAAHYRPGLMESVAERRDMQLVDCMISSPWHSLNIWMRVESKLNGEVAICRTTDVSAPEHQAMHKRRQLIELDWDTAARLCAISRVGERPPGACPVVAEVISEEAALAALAPPATPPQPTPAPEHHAPELLAPQPAPEVHAPQPAAPTPEQPNE